MDKREEFLKLDNQLCFSLYSASRAIIKAYKPLLDRLGVTYTQYLVLLVLWEEDGITLNQLGKKLILDSGTLTPLLKKMESAKLLTRKRSSKDERQINILLTSTGKNLKEKALEIPEQMLCKLPLDLKNVSNLRENLKHFYENIK